MFNRSKQFSKTYTCTCIQNNCNSAEALDICFFVGAKWFFTSYQAMSIRNSLMVDSIVIAYICCFAISLILVRSEFSAIYVRDIASTFYWLFGGSHNKLVHRVPIILTNHGKQGSRWAFSHWLDDVFRIPIEINRLSHLLQWTDR